MASKGALLSLLLLVAVASAAAAVTIPTKIVLRAAFSANGVASTPNYPGNLTSYLVQSGPVYAFNENNPKKNIGFAYGQVTVLYFAPGFTVYDLDTTYDFFSFGKLTVKGAIFDNVAPNLVPITGGTGIYKAARGIVKDTFLLPPYKFSDSLFEVKIEFEVIF